jgi:hypothetical protein
MTAVGMMRQPPDAPPPLFPARAKQHPAVLRLDGRHRPLSAAQQQPRPRRQLQEPGLARHPFPPASQTSDVSPSGRDRSACPKPARRPTTAASTPPPGPGGHVLPRRARKPGTCRPARSDPTAPAACRSWSPGKCTMHRNAAARLVKWIDTGRREAPAAASPSQPPARTAGVPGIAWPHDLCGR